MSFLQASLRRSAHLLHGRVGISTHTLYCSTRSWRHSAPASDVNIKPVVHHRHLRCAATMAGPGMELTHLTQAQAASIDEELMGPLGYSVDQLMELAGLSVACSLAAEYPASTHKRVLVVAGPGNNGGDGLVAGRHLTQFGYEVTVCYPKPTDKPLYNGLVTQLKAHQRPFVEAGSLQEGGPLKERYDVVVDAIFGFSFKGEPRPPFAQLLQLLTPKADPPVIVSVDIPSGWHVENGDESGQGMAPDMLVSLTAPKLAAKHFKGAHHYLGGRFVPPVIREKYNLVLPEYPSTSQCVRIGGTAPSASAAGTASGSGRAPASGGTSGAAAGAGTAAGTAGTSAGTGAAAAGSVDTASTAAGGSKGPAAPADMRVNYTKGELVEADVAPDPLQQFDAWFTEAVDSKTCEEPNAIALATCDGAGSPSVRMVLLKGYDERGFIFYTNYNSRKGRELAERGRAAFTVYWDKLQRSVRVEGDVERVPEAEATEYFHSRPRSSQIGAWVSDQSAVVNNGRDEIEARNQELQRTYEDPSVEVPKPPHWGGYLVRPTAIEFWQGRPSRLHDRLRFSREGTDGEWTMNRLYP